MVPIANNSYRPAAGSAPELGWVRGRHSDSFLRLITSAQVSGEAGMLNATLRYTFGQ